MTKISNEIPLLHNDAEEKKEGNQYFQKFINFFHSSAQSSNDEQSIQTCTQCHKKFNNFFLTKQYCMLCSEIFCKDCLVSPKKLKKIQHLLDLKLCEKCCKLLDTIDQNLFISIIDSKIPNFFPTEKKESKLIEYCKKSRSDTEDCYKFFLFKDKTFEDSLRNSIENNFEILLKSYIETVLKTEGGFLYEKWYEKVYDIVKTTIMNVNPSFKDLGDTMNINDYIKIKIVPYKDMSLCKVIDGFAMQKNICSKKMSSLIDNPKILLLNCDLDYKGTFDTFEAVLKQGREVIEGIEKKIEILDADLILINQNASRELLTQLTQCKKTLVLNVKKKSLDKIARCTKTFAVPSISLLGRNMVLGNCQKFKIEKINRYLDDTVNNSEIIKSNEYNLMTFEGCAQVLFSTVILSGPDISELKAIKRLLKRTIFLTARDYYLQKYFLYFFYLDIPKTPNYPVLQNLNANNEDLGRTSSVSFLHSYSVTSLKNESSNISQVLNGDCGSNYTLINNRNRIQFNDEVLVSNILNAHYSSFKLCFDEQGLLEERSTISFIKLTIVNNANSNPFPEASNNNNNNTSSLNTNTYGNLTTIQNEFNEQIDLTESEIQKKINSICNYPENINLFYYSRDNQLDKPLGKMIIDMCYEGTEKCDKCKKIKNNHVYYLFSSGGKIGISFIKQTTEYQLEKALEYINREGNDFKKYNGLNTKFPNEEVNYNIDIFMYGYCKICANIVTPLAKLPKEIFNFSSAKFLKHMVHNTDLKNRSDKKECNLSIFSLPECSHSFHDINRVFITQFGCLNFSYANTVKYKFDPGFLYDKKDSSLSRQILENCTKFARHKVQKVTGYLIKNFSVADEELNYLLTNEMFHIKSHPALSDTCGKLKDINKNNLNAIKDFNLFIEPLLSSPSKFVDYIKFQVFITNVYIKLIQYKLINNSIRKGIQKIKNCYEILMTKDINLVKTQQQVNQSQNQNPKDSLIAQSLNFLERSSVFSKLDDKKSQVFNAQSINSLFEYENIDEKSNYIYILNYILFYDDNHKQNTTHFKTDDLSSMIAYTLTSDKYQSFISSKKQFELTNIKCERKIIKLDVPSTPNFGPSATSTNFFNSPRRGRDKEEEKEHFYTNTDPSLNDMYNYLTIQNESMLYDTTLLFDSTRNTYYNVTIEKHKVLQQLESELINDDKNHFVYKMKTVDLRKIKTMNADLNFGGIKKKNNNDISMNLFQRKTSVATNNSNQEKDSERISKIMSSNVVTNFTQRKIQSTDGVGGPSCEVKKAFDDIDNILFEIKAEKAKICNELNTTTKEINNKFKFPKTNFKEDSVDKESCDVTVYYPRQFEALRITYCNTYEEFIMSISKSQAMTNQGGKSNADFYKSFDNKYILKCLTKHEFKMFIESGFQYFHHVAKYLFHKMPSALAKILGVYKIKFSSHEEVTRHYVVVMENGAYGIEEKQSIKTYDLKGSCINRYQKNKKARVLLDTNLKEDTNGIPIPIEKCMMDLLSAAIHNDTLLLSKINVIDYSLLMIKNENERTIRFRIIDYIRKYTWDKQLEHVGKTIINGLNAPTIISPVNYKERFSKVINEYFIGI